MTQLVLDNISVGFVLYQSHALSIKQTLLRTAIGGAIGGATHAGRVIVDALQAITIELREGDRLALLGHNGAGKSTLLRVMAGIHHPTRGAVRCVGRRVPLFDIHSGFDDEATGYENILLRGLLMGFSRAEMERKIDDIATFSGLGRFLDFPVRTYSSGMLLRLLFSISTSGDADILLMDEWIATGDREFLDRANRRLHELIDRSKILVFASHDTDLLRKICNRAVLLEGGQLVLDGALDTVIERHLKHQSA